MKTEMVDEFTEGQWWIIELDNMVKLATPDQKRAVAVVHNLLRQLKACTDIVEVEEPKKCCSCGTTENLYKDGWYGYRCKSRVCMVY